MESKKFGSWIFGSLRSHLVSARSNYNLAKSANGPGTTAWLHAGADALHDDSKNILMCDKSLEPQNSNGS